MLQSVQGYIDYYEGIRRRTLHFIDAIPADRIDWLPGEGEFTFGDLIRHLAATEDMFIGAVVNGIWKYAGHKIEAKQERDVAITLLKSTHQDAMKRLGTLSDSALTETRPSLSGTEVKTWRLLMAMVEHEVHHRSQMAMYLTLIKIKPPHIYGLKNVNLVEEFGTGEGVWKIFAAGVRTVQVRPGRLRIMLQE